MRDVIARSPRRLLVVLATISALLVPAAVAWACAPQSLVETDQQSYTPGEQMTVSGRSFRPDATITVTTDPPGPTATTTATSTGTFQTQLKAPSQPGPYVLLATSSHPFDPTARTTFEVVDAPASAEPPPPAPGRCANERLGTGGADNLSGTNAGDRIFAFAGDDVVNALAADDCLDGGSGNDRLGGGHGRDQLDGGRDRDTLAGGPGADMLIDALGDGLLYGQGGPDRIHVGNGRFRIDAGNENDYVSARNGRVDTINCGLGHDTARVDRFDRVAGCERVSRG